MDRAEWDRRYAGPELLWTAEPNRFLVEEVADLSPGRALDLGCGEGRNAVWLAECGWRVTAVDFSAVALGKARALARARGVEVELVEADLGTYSPTAGGFDLVLLLYIHVPADLRRAILGRARDALAPGGTLLVIGHDSSNLSEGYGGPQDGALLYGPDDLTADLAGLRIRCAERRRRPVATPDGERRAVDVVVRAVAEPPR